MAIEVLKIAERSRTLVYRSALRSTPFTSFDDPMNPFSTAVKATLLLAVTLPAIAAPGMAQSKPSSWNPTPNIQPKPLKPTPKDPSQLTFVGCDWRVDWEVSTPGDHSQKYLAKNNNHGTFVAPGEYPSGEYIRTKPILTNVGNGNCKPMSLTTKMGMKVDGTVGGPRSRTDENHSMCLGRGPNNEITPGAKCHGGVSVIPAPCPIGGGYTYAKLSWKPYQNSWTMVRNDPDGPATNRNHMTEVKFTTVKTPGDSCS